MPVMKCKKGEEEGFKYGESGTCYIGDGAEEKAKEQGRAIEANLARFSEDAGNWKYSVRSTDLFDDETMLNKQMYDDITHVFAKYIGLDIWALVEVWLAKTKYSRDEADQWMRANGEWLLWYDPYSKDDILAQYQSDATIGVVIEKYTQSVILQDRDSLIKIIPVLHTAGYSTSAGDNIISPERKAVFLSSNRVFIPGLGIWVFDGPIAYRASELTDEEKSLVESSGTKD